MQMPSRALRPDYSRYRLLTPSVYPASLPSAIPFVVYVRQSIFISGRFVWRILRACIAIISWLVILPIVTMATLRVIMAAVDFA